MISRFVGSRPHVRLCADSAEPAWGSFSLSLSLPPSLPPSLALPPSLCPSPAPCLCARTRSLSAKINKQTLKKEYKNHKMLAFLHLEWSVNEGLLHCFGVVSRNMCAGVCVRVCMHMCMHVLNIYQKTGNGRSGTLGGFLCKRFPIFKEKIHTRTLYNLFPNQQKKSVSQ